MPRVTVLLTSYNHEEFLEEAIRAILEQTYIDFELIIVDDCSIDNSWDIIQKYADKDKRIIAVRHDTNQGGSGLRSLLPDMKGELFAMAHSDDSWENTKLEKQIKLLDAKTDVAACFTGVAVIDDEGKLLDSNNHHSSGLFDQENRTRYEWLNYFFYNGNCLCHPSVLIRMSVFEEISILPRGLHGYPDLYQWIKLCQNAEIFIIPEPLTRFRIHADESNVSGENPCNLKRIYFEEFLILQEYKHLVATHEVIKVFPDTKKYVVAGEINEKYAFAQILLDGPRNAHHLLGLQLLYELFQNEEDEDNILRLYGYSRSSYNKDKQRYDVFNSIPENRYMHVTLYLNTKNGYRNDACISRQVFLQQTGLFQLSFDLSIYSQIELEKVRLDLDEGRYRKFKIIMATCNGRDINWFAINGNKQGQWFEFYTLDPQLETTNIKPGILNLLIETREISISEVENYFETLRKQLYCLQHKTVKSKIKEIFGK